jgi:hypothetical protein
MVRGKMQLFLRHRKWKRFSALSGFEFGTQEVRNDKTHSGFRDFQIKTFRDIPRQEPQGGKYGAWLTCNFRSATVCCSTSRNNCRFQGAGTILRTAQD